MQRRILKMKKLLLFLCCGLTLGGCVHSYDAQQEIYKRFPNSDIYRINHTDYYMVMDSIGIYTVRCGVPFTKNIWEIQLIKKWQSQ